MSQPSWAEARPDVPGWDLPAPWHYEPIERLDGPIGDRGDPRRPEFGPGYERSAGDGNGAKLSLTYGIRDQGAWSADDMTSVHGVVMPFPADHFGYQEGWGVDVTIARNDPQLPWDAGLSIGGHVGVI